MNLAQRANASAKMARLTTEARSTIAAAPDAPAEEREAILIETINLLVEALAAAADLLLGEATA